MSLSWELKLSIQADPLKEVELPTAPYGEATAPLLQQKSAWPLPQHWGTAPSPQQGNG